MEFNAVFVLSHVIKTVGIQKYIWVGIFKMKMVEKIKRGGENINTGCDPYNSRANN